MDVLALEGLLASSGSHVIHLGSGWRAVREYDRLRLERGSGAAPAIPCEMALPLPGAVEWGGVVVRAERADRLRAPDPSREAYVDGDAVRGPLRVRGMQPGDRIRPLGSRGSRKLQDVFVDLRVPAALRQGVPLVVSQGTILWVCGLVSAEQGRITPETDEVVRLSIGGAF